MDDWSKEEEEEESREEKQEVERTPTHGTLHWCVMLLLTGTNYYSASVLLQDMSPGNMQTYVAVVERSTLLNMTWRSMH